MFRKLIGAFVGLAMMGMAGTASAVPIGFSDRNLWEDSITDQILTENFDNVPPGVLPLNTTTTIGLIDVFTFASGGTIFQLTGSNVNGQVDIGPGNTPEGFSIIFTSPVSAFGADFVEACSNGRLTVQVEGDTLALSSFLGGSVQAFLD